MPKAHTPGMAIPHALSGQVIELAPSFASAADLNTHALFKTDAIEVIRLVLAAGKSLPPHTVVGDITIQCLQGKIDISFDGTRQVLSEGQLLYLAGGVEHAVRAHEDSLALVTIVLRKRL